MKKVYLAGPEVFLKDAARVLQGKVDICSQHGLTALVPVDNCELDAAMDRRTMAMAIYRGNVRQMEEADAIIANITPFRGPHMDPGTAFEIGYFAHAGKPILCYTQDPRELAQRVVDWSSAPSAQGHELRDHNGHLVEDFGMSENLMIEGSVAQQGGEVLIGAPFSQAFVCLHGFKDAVRSLASYWSSMPC